MEEIIVLMSTYNGEKYLRKQIDSILTQIDCKVKLLIRDDMSTDHTAVILEDYRQQGKLTWYQDGEKLGAAKSFLRLLCNAPESEFYSFADQDDVWNNDKLKNAIKKLKSSVGPVVYYANAELVNSQLESFKKNVYVGIQKPSLLMALCSCNVLGCTMVINKALADIVRKGGVPEKIIMHDNYICAVCAACGGTIYYDSEVRMKYRQHGSNVVGVQTDNSMIIKLKEKIKWVTQERKVSVGDQCEEILNRIVVQNEDCLPYVKMVSNYRQSFTTRLMLSKRLVSLVITREATKHELLNAANILLGNA